MTSPRDIRRCAVQSLYQFDVSGIDTPDIIRQTLDDSPGTDACHDQGFSLACAAWEQQAEADKAIGAISKDWPIHRQPVIDRSILRLAYHEMTSGLTPPKVAINEAVELAKEFSTEKSPLFINGILDKLYRIIRNEASPPPDTDTDTSTDTPPARLSPEQDPPEQNPLKDASSDEPATTEEKT